MSGVPEMSFMATIEAPAKLPDVGLRFEENFVGDLLLHIHGQKEDLPLLQLTLTELVERRDAMI